jgi:hypothetical protein
MKSEKTFIKLFDIILTGDRDESRKAAREVRKFLYSSSCGRFDEIKSIINSAPEKHANIKEDWREVNFVVAVSVLYYLHDREKEPDFLFSWLFSLLLHENGNIRQSAVRMIEHELGPLAVHIRCPETKHSDWMTPEKADAILLNLFMQLNRLLSDLWKPSYKKYKYISSLPTSSYKSVQMILSCIEDDCGEKYMGQMEDIMNQTDKLFNRN